MTSHLIRKGSSSFLGTMAPHQQVAKSFYCVFCREIASLRMGDFPQFQQHMEGVHKVYYEYDILLAVNFIERSEKDTIIERVKRKVGGGGGCQGGQEDFGDQTSQTYFSKHCKTAEPIF